MKNYLHTKAGRISIVMVYLLVSAVTIYPFALSSTRAGSISERKSFSPAGKNGLPNKIYIYLSSDDGPAAGSLQLDSISRADSIKINVFIIGKFVLRNDSMRRIFELYRNNSGIEVGNHSFTHANKQYRRYYEDPEEVVSDFNKNNDTLHLPGKIARLPGRNCWRVKGKNYDDLPDVKAAADSLAAHGYIIFGWDLEWREYPIGTDSIRPALAIIARMEELIRKRETVTPGNIVILCHDPMFKSSQAMSEFQLFIRKVKEKGNYQFEYLSKYPVE